AQQRRSAKDRGEHCQASRRRSRLKKEAPTDDVEASNVRLIRLTIRGQSADGVRREIITSTFDAKTMASSIKALGSAELSEFTTGSKGTRVPEQTGEAHRCEYRQAAGAIKPPPNVGSAMTQSGSVAHYRRLEFAQHRLFFCHIKPARRCYAFLSRAGSESSKHQLDALPN